jgi:hypothetical protein
MCEKEAVASTAVIIIQLKFNIMNTSKYFTKTIQFLTDLKNKNSEKHAIENELIDRRFEIQPKDALAKAEVSRSLLFLMYSKENETLFI